MRATPIAPFPLEEASDSTRARLALLYHRVPARRNGYGDAPFSQRSDAVDRALLWRYLGNGHAGKRPTAKRHARMGETSRRLRPPRQGSVSDPPLPVLGPRVFARGRDRNMQPFA
jgi:hypothetical protein